MKLFTILLTVLFIGLKLAGTINWSWCLVLCPFPAWLVLETLRPFAYGFVLGVAKTLKK